MVLGRLYIVLQLEDEDIKCRIFFFIWYVELFVA